MYLCSPFRLYDRVFEWYEKKRCRDRGRINPITGEGQKKPVTATHHTKSQKPLALWLLAT
jgi:hypothetical protein